MSGPAPIVLPCDPDCEACFAEAAEAAEIAETRKLALEAPDWRGLGNRCGVMWRDMDDFLKGNASLTAPMRKLIREALT